MHIQVRNTIKNRLADRIGIVSHHPFARDMVITLVLCSYAHVLMCSCARRLHCLDKHAITMSMSQRRESTKQMPHLPKTLTQNIFGPRHSVATRPLNSIAWLHGRWQAKNTHTQTEASGWEGKCVGQG